MTSETVNYSDFDKLAEAVASVSEISDRIIAAGRAGDVNDQNIAQPLYVAARLFAARRDRTGATAWPIRNDALNATETVVLVTALLEAADVNLFDMAIWYRRAE